MGFENVGFEEGIKLEYPEKTSWSTGETQPHNLASPLLVNPGFTGGCCGRHEHCHTFLFDKLSHSPVIVLLMNF